MAGRRGVLENGCSKALEDKKGPSWPRGRNCIKEGGLAAKAEKALNQDVMEDETIKNGK
jgi:hypothetical protein